MKGFPYFWTFWVSVVGRRRLVRLGDATEAARPAVRCEEPPRCSGRGWQTKQLLFSAAPSPSGAFAPKCRETHSTRACLAL